MVSILYNLISIGIDDGTFGEDEDVWFKEENT